MSHQVVRWWTVGVLCNSRRALFWHLYVVFRPREVHLLLLGPLWVRQYLQGLELLWNYFPCSSP
ncbi:hypothetical protein GBA52_014921 [Prunus armeniaca]|nr:hypothetical protein GBA52_014921 [Prunus armeniaca]